MTKLETMTKLNQNIQEETITTTKKGKIPFPTDNYY